MYDDELGVSLEYLTRLSLDSGLDRDRDLDRDLDPELDLDLDRDLDAELDRDRDLRRRLRRRDRERDRRCASSDGSPISSIGKLTLGICFAIVILINDWSRHSEGS